MWRAAGIAVAPFLIPKTVLGVASDDDICNRLDAFDRAPFPSGMAPRSVVVLWKPGGILGTVDACITESQPARSYVLD